MIFRGRKVLDGTLESIQDRYGNDTIRIRMPNVNGRLTSVEGVQRVNDFGPYKELRMTPGANPQAILRSLAELGPIEHFELARPSLHDIFVRIAGPDAVEEEVATHA